MSINPIYDSGDVNCLVTLSESIFAAGSMDGSLRFFHADQGASSQKGHRKMMSWGQTKAKEGVI